MESPTLAHNTFMHSTIKNKQLYTKDHKYKKEETKID